MTFQAKILISDDDEALCYLLKEQLIEQGHQVDTVFDGKYAIEKVKRNHYDVVLLDLNMQLVAGEEVLKFIRERYPTMPVIILSAENQVSKAIECIKLGAYDYVPKPFNFDDLLITINRALEHKELIIKNELLRKQASKRPHKIIGESTEIRRVIELAEKAARSDSNLLIEGETGTGKELFAEYIHYNSSRKDKSFVIINCASLPDQLIESELFGHEKGAFTDAKSAKQGLVEIADGGTLFLDEIGEMSLNIQPKLLRFLENGEYRRVGGTNSQKSNVRVIGATNRNLIQEAEKKNFRRDLLFRLNVITLTIPPLRDRPDDIIPLANFFLGLKSPVRTPILLKSDAIDALKKYPFVGNVRELEHIIERAVVFSDNNEISAESLHLPAIKQSSHQPLLEEGSHVSEGPTTIASLEDVERRHILKALEHFNWERAKTAQQLGISQKTLYTKIKKYELHGGGQ
jgi:DNA-binding NtrC family response regulator